jgi:2-dehydropantoate 2-reductase
VRHAILGVGGVGGLIGGALAQTSANVLLLLRPETLARHPGRLRVESIAFGDFEVEVATASVLDREVDVVWVAPKATQLEEALKLAPADKVGEAVVVPLLNGVDHVALLRKRYAHVLGAAIFVESERVEPGLVRQKTTFANIVLSPARATTRSGRSCVRQVLRSRLLPMLRRCCGRSSPSWRPSR